MDCKSAKSIWDKLSSIYEGDEKVKEAKLQNFRTKFESLKMTEEERVVDYLLRIQEIVNSIHGLGEALEEKVVKKVLRSLTPKYDTKISAVEKRDINKPTLDELHGVFTSYEMRMYIDNPISKEISFKSMKKDNDINSNSEKLDNNESILVRK